MTNHRIKIIALFSAITLSFGPAVFASTNSNDVGPVTPRAAAPATESKSTDLAATSDPAAKAHATATRDSSVVATDAAAASVSGHAASSSASSMSLERVTDGAKDRLLGDFKGREITGSAGEKLGKVHDFLIDTHSGEITGVIVSSGGALGVGDKLHVIQHGDLQRAADGKSFTARLDQAAFSALPVASEKDFEVGKVSADAKTGSAAMRASKIAGKDVEVAGKDIGEIENVAIDLEHGRAQALLDVEDDFAGSDGKFLVPFARLQFGAGERDKVSASLSRADFAGVTIPSAATSSITASLARTETEIAPTVETAATTLTKQTDAERVAGTTATAGINVSKNTTAAGEASVATPEPGSTDRSRDVAAAGAASTSGAVSVNPTSKTSEIADTDRSLSSTATASSPSLAASSTTAEALKTDSETLTPTGRTSAEQNPYSGAASSVLAASSAIRTALDNDETLRTAGVRVVPDSGKVALRGTVSGEETKQKIAQIAEKAASGTPIENEIKVAK